MVRKFHCCGALESEGHKDTCPVGRIYGTQPKSDRKIMKIFKYEFDCHTETCSVKMPQGAKIVHIGMQHTKACIWALVDPSMNDENKTVETRGTGHNCNGLPGLPDGILFDNGFVWHVWVR